MKSTSYIQRRSPMWRDLPIDLISRSPIARWAPIPLRLIVGYGFMEHGFAKLARGLEATAVKIILVSNSLFVCDTLRRGEKLKSDCHGSACEGPGRYASWSAA